MYNPSRLRPVMVHGLPSPDAPDFLTSLEKPMRGTKVAIVSALLLAGFEPASFADPPEWTVMIYGCGDSSAEDHLMPHVRSLALLSKNGRSANVVLLFDRAPGFSEDGKLFGENFEDTRLFALDDGSWNREGGGDAFPEITLDSKYEANTGDATTLKKFIRFTKSAYPAKRFAVIFFGHGHSRSFCPDKTSDNDEIYTAELTEVLGPQESVEFAWFDVCSYGGIENAYQFRPVPGRFAIAAMIATPPSSSPAPMRTIFRNAGLVGEPANSPPKSGIEFGNLAVQLTEKHWRERAALSGEGEHESWGCYDLTRAEQVKRDVDRLAALLAEHNPKSQVESIRGFGASPPTMHYFPPDSEVEWAASPHFDLYDLARRLHESATLPEDVRSAARGVTEGVGAMITASFGMDFFPGFEGGKNGIFITFPDGSATREGKSHWSRFGWYHPADRRNERHAFGLYDWCKVGATPNNGKVENWFELLDSWYDDAPDGGVNNYRW